MRLPGFDYSNPGAYFFTTNTKHRQRILGELRGWSVQLTPAGLIVRKVWRDLPRHYPHVLLDVFAIMPDHVHGILYLEPTAHPEPPLVAAGLRPAAAELNQVGGKAAAGLSEVIRALKAFSARAINQARRTPGAPVWQRGYHERVVRSEEELDRLREYIPYNPELAGLGANHD